jgi:hypothetical protein
VYICGHPVASPQLTHLIVGMQVTSRSMRSTLMSWTTLQDVARYHCGQG